MKFEVGKYYEHTTGHQLSIICATETTLYGRTLIAETNTNETFIAVGSDESSAVNYHEISENEWMRNFSK